MAFKLPARHSIFPVFLLLLLLTLLMEGTSQAVPPSCLEGYSSLHPTATSPSNSPFLAPGSELQSAVDSQGRIHLGAPRLCSSYTCRSQLLSGSSVVAGMAAMASQLMACALPQEPGYYEMLDFVVSGLGSAPDEWWPFVAKSLEDLGVRHGDLLAKTWFPAGSGRLEFYISCHVGCFNSSGALTMSSLSQVLDQQVNPSWESYSLPFASASPPVSISVMRLSEIHVQPSKNAAAAATLSYLLSALGLLAIYGLLVALAHYFGPPWLQPLVLCWGDLCLGGGCLVWRILLAPLVMIYNAARIYCWSCCLAYLAKMGQGVFCKKWFWHDFKDTDFPPNDHSLGKVVGDTASGEKNQGGAEWARASMIAGESGESPHLFQGKIEAADVLQGALGDCWLMAALACVAERPEVLDQAIVTKHLDPRGKYHFRLWNQIRGNPGCKWVDVIIDEFIPVHPGTLKPKFARAHCNEMWVLLIEKAFAKMYGGYDKLDGGQMGWALSAITGNPALTIQRQQGSSTWTCGKDELTGEALFQVLRKVRRNGAFLCCAEIALADKHGLIDGHAYSIIKLTTVRRTPFDTAFFRMVQIRNPHGQTEWQGAWSDKSQTWGKFPHVKQQLLGDAQAKEDGTFWMQWEDFLMFWKEVQVVDCAVNIRTISPPLFNESWYGPAKSCLLGCWEYWCCCLGFRRLYFGRTPTTSLKEMQEGMDAQVGWDQEGCFCDILERKATASDQYGEGDEHGETSETSPLVPPR